MGGGHHLREVDHSYVVLVVQHKVELVKVSMNQAVIGQFDYELHELTVEARRILQVMHLTPGRQQCILNYEEQRVGIVCCCYQ